MANIKSQIKRIKTNEKARLRNKSVKSSLKTAIRKFREAADAGADEIAAVEGSFASVIGGAPAAATVFARDVKQRVERDPRVGSARAEAASASGREAAALRAKAARVVEEVRSEKLHEVAEEFDAIHTIERALRVGSVDRIIPADTLRPYVVDALQRGIARAGSAAGAAAAPAE